MLRWLRADLHVHTCLSPCAELMMSPRRIVEEALHRELDLIAVTDHNSAENVAAVVKAVRGASVAVLPGMEICSSEEVHVLALFESVAEALKMQEAVYRGISGKNTPEAFGLQVIANEHDEVEGFQEKLLIGATAMSIDEVVRRIHELGGLAIASHIDRETYGIIGHLGFIPRDVTFDALEISASAPAEKVRQLSKEYSTYEFVRNSDAHAPGQLGSERTSFFLEAPTCEELRMAFRREGGRRVAGQQAGAPGHY
jgi:predicted metal-dependent phosphoesterase TrpH